MNQFTHVARRLAAGAVVALAMTVGLTSFTVAGSSAAETSSRGVVGKSDLGKITSKVVGQDVGRRQGRGLVHADQGRRA